MKYTARTAANEVRDIMDKVFAYVCTDNSLVSKDILVMLDLTAKALEDKADQDGV